MLRGKGVLCRVDVCRVTKNGGSVVCRMWRKDVADRNGLREVDGETE